jgi:hypothetical protein
VAYPEQKFSAVGAKLHLQVLSQPNTTTSVFQIVTFDFPKFEKPRGDTVPEIGNITVLCF